MIAKLTNLLSGIFYKAEFKGERLIIDFLGDVQLQLGLNFDFQNQNWENLIAPTDALRVKKSIKDAIFSDGTYQLEYMIILPDKTTVHILDKGVTSIKEDDIYIEGYLENITKIKIQNATIKQHKTLCLQLEKLSNSGSWIYDIDTKDCWWSHEFYRICGITPDSKASLDLFYQIVHWEDLETFQNELQNAIENKKSFEIQIRFTHSGNNIRHIKLIGSVLISEMDSRQLLLSISDITSNIRTEKELKIENSRLTRAEEMGGTGNWEIDLNNNTVIASWGAQQIYEFDDAVYTLDMIQKIPIKKYREALNKELKLLIEGKKEYNIKFEIKTLKTHSIKHLHSKAIYRPKQNKVFGVIHDITEQEKNLNELNNISGKFESMAINSIDIIWQMDTKLRFKYLSPSLKKVLGLEPEDWIGTPLYSHTTWKHFAKMARYALRTIADHKNFDHFKFESYIYNSEKELVPVEINGKPLLDSKYRLIGLQGVTRDITELVQHRTEIENLNTRLTIANESVSNGIWDWNLETNELIWDSMMFKLYGISPTEFNKTYEFWRQALLPEDLEKAENELKNVIESKGVFDYQFRIKHPKLGIRFIRAFAKYTELKSPHLIGVNYDNTERVHSKRRIKESENLFRNIFDQNNDIILLLNPDGDILDMNQKGIEYFNVESTKAKKISFRDITVSIEEQIHSEDVINRLKKKEIIKPYIKNFKSLGGAIAPFEVSVSGIYDQDGDLIQLVSILRDIKERLEHEKELQKQKRRAEESDKLKSAFLMNVSHEIRTPLNGIMGFTEILNAELQDTEFKEFINIIEDSSNRLLNSIDDILDISYIQTNQVSPSIHEFVLGDLLTNIFNKYTKIYRTKLHEIEFNLNIDPEYYEIVLQTDQQKLQTAISKLVDNALKFTHSGRVSINCYLSDTQLYLSIEDTGVGIEESKIKNIFEFFNQGENTLTRSFEGLGLGLTISSNLLKALGTELKVSSKYGEGSRFWFKIPTADMNPQAAINTDENGSEKNSLHKVLLVDRVHNYDNPQQLFVEENCELHVANLFEEAENLLEDIPFNAIFIFISNMNSEEKELISNIRNQKIQTKIVVISKSHSLSFKKELLALGANEVISDQINKETIANIIHCDSNY